MTRAGTAKRLKFQYSDEPSFDNAGEDISNSREHFLGTNNIVQNESMFLVNLSANVKCIYSISAKTGVPKILRFRVPKLFLSSRTPYM